MRVASFLVFVVLAACAARVPAEPGATAATADADVRRDDRERVALSESAKAWWEAVRWGDATAAGALLARAEDQPALVTWLDARSASRKLVDVAIVSVELDAFPGESEPRGATVWVRTEGYAVPDQVLRTDTFPQRWVRLPKGWTVAWPPGPENAATAAPSSER